MPMTICTLRRVLARPALTRRRISSSSRADAGQRGQHVAQARAAQLRVEHQRGDDQVGAGVVEVVGELLERGRERRTHPEPVGEVLSSCSRMAGRPRSPWPGSPARGPPRRRSCRAATRSRPRVPRAGRSRPARSGRRRTATGAKNTSSPVATAEHHPAGEHQDHHPGGDRQRQPGADAPAPGPASTARRARRVDLDLLERVDEQRDAAPDDGTEEDDQQLGGGHRLTPTRRWWGW